jgi:hypothetical protein
MGDADSSLQPWVRFAPIKAQIWRASGCLMMQENTE